MDERAPPSPPPGGERASAFGCLVAGGALLAATGGTCAWLGAGNEYFVYAGIGLLMIAIGFYRFHDG